MSIRTRIMLAGVGIVMVVICCLSSSLYALISRGLGNDRDTELSARADAAVASLASVPPADLAPSRALAPIDPRSSVDIYLVVLADDGTVLSSTGLGPALPAELLAAARRDGRAAASIPLPGGQPDETVRVQVRRWTRADLKLSGFVVAGQTSRKTNQDRAGLIVLFTVSGFITFVAAAVAVWFATGRALRPLRQMAAMADSVGRSQNLDARLPAVRAQDAVGRLTTSFNAMMDRLQQAYARVASALAAQQRFTADASHELRTPLTTIRNNAEFLLQHPSARDTDRDAALRDIAGESVRMSRLIENLLTLARADGGVRLHRVPVDLAVLAEAVCRQAAALHPTREIGFAGTPARAVAGDEDMLRQLLWILLDNAVKFTRPAGRVWVAVTQRGATVVLTVADDGIGLPSGAAQRIFDRFYRADPSRSGTGTGLGLAIASWIVGEHGGTVVAANNDRGGATFSVELPAAPRPDEPTLAIPGAPHPGAPHPVSPPSPPLGPPSPPPPGPPQSAISSS
jgi:two-component system, OmpR family, sensor kinase